MQLFLLIGQSNMEGVPAPASEDLLENPRVRVLGYDTFGDRKWNEWDTASPPLHRSWAGVGPGDSFGKAMADAWPDAVIGLVPCAISGVDIDFFIEGVTSARRKEFQIPP
ncbi:MAG TPA: sialate O-acetylesterase, partial [Polyangiaceae bacterium]|nr:sialate O-acetylesterase [Polyangiaceae bacterium]